ncbi:MAG: tRNA pseudouridine(55) synthase TruB [Azospirillaceae bacterium]
MARRRKGRPVNGWLNLDKPAGLTSTEALGKVKRLVQPQKAGHGGTLDPLATGVLPIALGEATKTVAHAMDSDKDYRFVLTWGAETDTLDAEGKVVATSDVRPGPDEIEAALGGFIGAQMQVPPAYSAIKVGGERAYDLARDGEVVEIAARPVWIERLELLDAPSADQAAFFMTCGKGTYVRALARDLARALGAHAHVSSLIRTRVGVFSLDDAVSLDQLAALSERSDTDSVLLPVDAPLDDIPAVDLTAEEAHRMRCGQPVSLLRRSDAQRLLGLDLDLTGGEIIVLTRDAGKPVALARLEAGQLQPVRVLNV